MTRPCFVMQVVVGKHGSKSRIEFLAYDGVAAWCKLSLRDVLVIGAAHELAKTVRHA